MKQQVDNYGIQVLYFSGEKKMLGSLMIKFVSSLVSHKFWWIVLSENELIIGTYNGMI